ncbi:MAG: hypothetical protein WB660_30290 [Candidatus Sulfotelmatobacter sp.]
MSSLTVSNHLPDAVPDSLDSLLFAKGASVGSNHTHFFSPESGVFDRHAEQHVLVFLVVGSKGTLVEQYVFRVVRARPCKVWELLPYDRDQIRLPLHTLFVRHKCHENN